MTTPTLPITPILKGHTQSLFQALRLLQADSQRDPALTDIELPELLQQLLNDSPGLHRIADNTLLLSSYLQQCGRQLPVGPQTALPFIDRLLSQLYWQARPHPRIDAESRQLTALLAVRLLSRPDIAINREHPLCQLLQQLFQCLAIWEPGAGRAGRALPAWLQAFSQQLLTLDINASHSLPPLIDELQQMTTQEQTRAALVEQRLLEVTAGSADLDIARQTVVTYISRRLNQQPLPPWVADFILSPLLADLQYLLIHQGVDCPLWKKWQRLLQVLSWAFLQENSDSHRTKVNTLLPPLIEQLGDSYYRSLPNPEPYADFLAALQHGFMDILTGRTVDCVPFVGPDDPLADEQTVIVEQSLIEDLSRYQVGDWFLFLHREQTACGKLLIKDPHHNRLLFNRYTGQKLVEYNFEEFGLALASRLARPLLLNKLYSRALQSTLQQLERQYQQQQAREQQQEQQRAEQQARQQAAAKARREALSLSRQPAPAAGHPLAPDLDDPQRQQLEQQLRSLHVGAWLSLQPPGHEPADKIKLSVKLQSSDKYIFTDRLGQRLGDYSLAELVSLMASGRLAILSRGEEFESSLEKVVRGLRKPNL